MKTQNNRLLGILAVAFLYIGLILPVKAPADENLGSILLQYKFERDKVITAGRSKIIDLIGAHDYDSIQIVVAYCDSITGPVKNWLTNTERFIIHYILKDTSYLRNPAIYRECFGLKDSLPPAEGTDPFNPDYIPRARNKWLWMFRRVFQIMSLFHLN
jgi:hypothetical protein